MSDDSSVRMYMNRFYWVLLGFTGFYWGFTGILPGFYRLRLDFKKRQLIKRTTCLYLSSVSADPSRCVKRSSLGEIVLFFLPSFIVRNVLWRVFCETEKCGDYRKKVGQITIVPSLTEIDVADTNHYSGFLFRVTEFYWVLPATVLTRVRPVPFRWRCRYGESPCLVLDAASRRWSSRYRVLLVPSFGRSTPHLSRPTIWHGGGARFPHAVAG